MSDLISRADAICEVLVNDGIDNIVDRIRALPSAETHEIRTETHGVCSDLIRRADAIAYIERVINSGLGRNKLLDYIHKYISALPSADAVQADGRPHELWEDGTLVVKVPNAREVGRVFVQDEDENVHIGGGLFYPESDDAVHGEW